MNKLFKILVAVLLPLNLAVAKVNITGEIVKIEVEDKKHITTIKLTNKDGSPVTPDQLQTFHTEKIHLLIIDDSLSDYSHIHPTPTENMGEYEFDWYPKKLAKYKIWADIMPNEESSSNFVVINVENKIAKRAKIDRSTQKKVTHENLTFNINYTPKVLTTKKDGQINIKITDADGNPFTGLEPIMGAFAHLVGFSEDFKTVAHIHPMGEEPEWFWENGGPELEFHINPPKAGFYKFFLQLKIDGQEHFVPFGALVK